ncbi:hypothetical protein D5281_08415 [bacterium 1xD42-62]|uniref:Uncharacterized protein n=2 Tax=Parablautia muri TaxID=2320879 RepID=A0A9X5BGG8_9FIRM|nr:hypothetical protein [Parablautia muri]
MKMAAMMMAMTMVMGSAMTVHASEDGCARDEGASAWAENESVGFDDTDSNDSSSSSDSGYSEPSESYDNGSYDNGSSDSGSYDSGSSDNGNSSSNGGNNSGASYSAPAKRAPASNTGMTGKEQFRALAKSGKGSYKVTHKGQTIATFWLVDAEGKSVSCTAVALKQRTDGKWAIDFQVTGKMAEGTKAADTTGLTIGAPTDRTYMYTVLGVSYVTINDAVIIDIEAEAAQQQKR